MNFLRKLLHRHKWRGMSGKEWDDNGGIGTPDYICDECGERRWHDEISGSKHIDHNLEMHYGPKD